MVEPRVFGRRPRPAERRVCSSGLLISSLSWPQVVLKIIKHCKENLPNLVTGQLLGLDIGSTLEVTNCFPYPNRGVEEEDGEDDGMYQLEMMRCLRDVNVDNNHVGWCVPPERRSGSHNACFSGGRSRHRGNHE